MQTEEYTVRAPLSRLHQLSGPGVVELDPDVTGWEVYGSDGQKVGLLDELIVDSEAMKIRYLELEMAGAEHRHVLIPVGLAEIDEERQRVQLQDLEGARLDELPVFTGDSVDRQYERELQRVLFPEDMAVAEEDFYGRPQYDERRFYAGRSRHRGVWEAEEGREETRAGGVGEEEPPMAEPKSIFSVRTLNGMAIINPAGQILGRIEGILVDIERRLLAYAIVSSGGVLGVGESHYIVPWKALTPRLRNDSQAFEVQADKLKRAPELSMENIMNWTFGRDVHHYYGVTPYWEDEHRSKRPGLH